MIKPSMYCKYLLTGGGSSTLQRFLETKFIEDKEKVFLEDGYYANAKGLYRKAIRIFNEKEGAK
jgi:ATP-dependent phosphoenolpyruvate carboxykinase